MSDLLERLTGSKDSERQEALLSRIIQTGPIALVVISNPISGATSVNLIGTAPAEAFRKMLRAAEDLLRAKELEAVKAQASDTLPKDGSDV